MCSSRIHSSRTWLSRGNLRFFSSLATKRKAAKSVNVPCGTNGSIRLDIHSDDPPTLRPLIIYLPPGPLPSNASHRITASQFAQESKATVVQINYRLSDQHRYPTPVHDVLFGYDWIIENLAGEKSINPHENAAIQVGVMGELIGGGLATMLALTECHQRGHRVAAAAVHNPMLDWLSPETLAQEELHVKPPRKSAKNRAPTRVQNDSTTVLEMVKMRTAIFKKPEDWFDPFASPVLFFRSPGVVVPKEDPGKPRDDFEELSRLEQQEAILEQVRLAAREKEGNSDVEREPRDTLFEGTASDESKSPRKAARRYPKVGSGLALPAFNISTASSGLYFEQAQEFVHMVRRSMLRVDDDKLANPELALQTAEQRVQHRFDRDMAQKGQRAAELEDLACWFQDHL